MGRLSATFVAFCMMVIAGSTGIVSYLTFGFTGMEAAVVGVAVMTALVMVNSITSQQRDRFDVGSQIADLSRATADIGRQVSELDRRIVAMEGEVASAVDRSREMTEPLVGEIDELGQLVKELADAVAAHEQMIESATAHTPPSRANPFGPMAGPALAPDPVFGDDDVEDDADEPAPMPRPVTGPLRGLAPDDIVAQLARAIDANSVDLYLQPIVTLPQRKVRYYEALTRLRADSGALLAPEDFGPYAERGGLTAAIDNLMVFRSVQVVRRLSSKNREVGLFCNIAGATLTNTPVFREIVEFLQANRVLTPYLIFQFSQGMLRHMGAIEQECLAGLADIGFRFSLDQVTDLRVEPRELSDRGFRFVKVPAKLLLSRAAAPHGDIHPADFSDLLGRFGIDLLADKIESESHVVDLLDYDVRFGQGVLFSPPRPVRAEVLQGITERSAERTAPPVRTNERPVPVADAPEEAEPKVSPARASAMAKIARGRRAKG